MPDGALLIVVFGPAVVGVIALVLGIRMLSRRKRGHSSGTAQNVVPLLLLTVAFGIGTCYAVLLLKEMR